ncbi:MAG: hypothetical protein HRT89_02800 [Lentisphaeria bacterium]|nr:hypothetical protein [Lentisphaeria bacterium]
MAKKEEKQESKPKKGHPLLVGLVLGLIIGFGGGIFWKTSEATDQKIEVIKHDAKEGFTNQKNKAKLGAANLADQAADKLREDTPATEPEPEEE